ncbi:hypothetical protein Goklo_017526 [Gossypium klotzschianum]|uniref:DUF4283 domain-containing protein n=1 Tax=Gossypium klotzschianum TaxID=34286 RepID=A0A7J8UHR7_9ROSI|nr:hypothetical protein [Gossypium klotzschianum]
MFRIGPSRKGIRPRASCGVGHNPKNTVMTSFQSLTPASCKREQAKTTMRIEVGRPRPDEKRAWFDGIPATQSQTELGRAGGQRDSGRSHHQQKMKKEEPLTSMKIEDEAPWRVLVEGNAREDPLQVPLFSMDFWIQIHDLSNGLFNETMAKQCGGFLGKFIDYDAKAITRAIVRAIAFANFSRCLESIYGMGSVNKAMPRRAMMAPSIWLRE